MPWMDQPGLLVHRPDFLEVVATERLHLGRKRLRDDLGALEHDRLEELGAHDGAHAGPPAGPPLQAADRGVADHVLAALADVQDADALAVLRVDPVVGRDGALAPDLVGRQVLDAVVLDVEHGGAVGLALDDQRVVARLADLVGDARAQVPIAVAAGCRRLRGDDRLAGVGGWDAGDGADRHDELVLGPEGVDPRSQLVVEDLHGEPAAADPRRGEVLGERLHAVRPVRQVDPEDLPGPTIHRQLILASVVASDHGPFKCPPREALSPASPDGSAGCLRPV